MADHGADGGHGDAPPARASTTGLPRLRRIRHPGRALVATGTLVVCATTAFALGRFLDAPSRDAILAAQDPIVVTATVERRVVDDAVDYAATVRAGDVADLSVTGVVVRRTVVPGDRVAFGALVGVVEGAPLFALPAPLPLYRDLARGDRGDDVSALQAGLAAAGLGVPVTGIVDSRTLAGVRELFARAGFPVPPAGSIPIRHFLALSAPGVVVAAAAVGDRLDGTVPLVSVRISPPHIAVRVDPVTGADLGVGDAVTVRASGARFAGTVARVGPYDEGSDGEAPGRDVVVGADAEAMAGLELGASVTVSIGTGAAEESLAVPITAIREDEGRAYVELEDRRHERFERVAVRILRSGDGWVAIESDGLEAGDPVRVR